MPSTGTVRRIALAAASVLAAGFVTLAPASPAQAADTFGGLKITGISSKKDLTVPLAATTVRFTVSFTGPAASSEVVYRPWNTSAGKQVPAAVTAVATNHARTLDVPTVTSPTVVAPGTQLAYSLTLTPYKTPGRYRLTIPIEQLTRDRLTGAWKRIDLSASVQFEVIANKVLTSAPTWSVLTASGAFSKKAKWSWKFNGPDYERGATIKIYYRASGAKKYAVVASGKLNGAGDAAFKGKTGAIRKTGRAYYVLSAVPFSPQTKSGQYLIKKATAKP
jgi:hypothetical protein